MQVAFNEFGAVDDASLKYAVIVAKYGERWVYVRHKERRTWEIPGGRRESGEAIGDTAKRELYEETGAVRYTLVPLCAFSVVRGPDEKSFGGLFYSEIDELGSLPDSEIGEVAFFDGLPSELTYPMIQPELFAEARRVLADGRSG